jgi:hypothetical protein
MQAYFHHWEAVEWGRKAWHVKVLFWLLDPRSISMGNMFSSSRYVHFWINYVTKILEIWFHKFGHFSNISVCSTGTKWPAICLLRLFQLRKGSFVWNTEEHESGWFTFPGMFLKVAPFLMGIQNLLKTYIFWVLLAIHNFIFWAVGVTLTSSGVFPYSFIVIVHRRPLSLPCWWITCVMSVAE